MNVHGPHSICYIILKAQFKYMSMKLGFSIPLSVFGPGLSICHYGTIVVNGKGSVGANCRIQTDTLIGGGMEKKATLSLGIIAI